MKSHSFFSVLWIGAFSALILASCSSTRKQIEQRKRRDNVAEKTGLFCDFVQSHEDQEMAVELNLKLAKSCEPQPLPQIIPFTMDTENRGVLFCCKKKETSHSDKEASQAEAFIDSQNNKNNP
jgi:hypothetical protein